MSKSNKRTGQNKRTGGILPNMYCFFTVSPTLRVNLVLKRPTNDTFFKNWDLLPILSQKMLMFYYQKNGF